MTLLEQVLITILTASLTAFFAYFGFWRQAKAELQKEYKSRFNQKKWDAYYSFINLIPVLIEVNRYSDLHNKHKLSESQEYESDELAKTYHNDMSKVEHQILLVGSKNVVKIFMEWSEVSGVFNVKDEPNVEILIKLVNAMREDLGLEKSDLSVSDLDGSYFISYQKEKELSEDYEKNNYE